MCIVGIRRHLDEQKQQKINQWLHIFNVCQLIIQNLMKNFISVKHLNMLV